MYEQLIIQLWLWSPFILGIGAVVGALPLIMGLVPDEPIWFFAGGLTLLAVLIFGIWVAEAPKRLSSMAQTQTSHIDLEGVVRCNGEPVCTNRVLLLDETGKRTELFLQTTRGYTLMDGDSVSLSRLGTPAYEFTFPALCQNDKCWILSNRDREGAICEVSRAHACMSGRQLRGLWGGMDKPGFRKTTTQEAE